MAHKKRRERKTGRGVKEGRIGRMERRDVSYDINTHKLVFRCDKKVFWWGGDHGEVRKKRRNFPLSTLAPLSGTSRGQGRRKKEEVKS